MIETKDGNEIRTYSCPKCYLCGNEGKLLYQSVKDRLFGAPGEWNLKKCTNPECGLVWLDPMPLEEDIGKAYQTYYTHQDTSHIPDTVLRRFYRLIKEGYLANKYGYLNSKVATWQRLLSLLMYFDPSRCANLDFSVMYLPSQPNASLLEVGCGGGRMLKIMKDLGWNVEGVDFDPSAVENAKSKGLCVNCGTLSSQGYPDNNFDVITMSHLIEHIHEPLKLLDECYRILKPGGKLVIVTPNIKALGHTYFKESWLHLDPPRHLHIFTPNSLENLTKKAGFSTTNRLTAIRDANGLFLASRSIQQTGKYNMSTPQTKNLKSRIWTKTLQLWEWLILKVRPNVGEEIVLIGKKS